MGAAVLFLFQDSKESNNQRTQRPVRRQSMENYKSPEEQQKKEQPESDLQVILWHIKDEAPENTKQINLIE